MKTLKVTSSAFVDGGNIAARYTCDGENINPPIAIDEAPAGAKSLALIMDDPDAPSGTWVHWVKFNMPPATRMIEEGKEPAGLSGKGTRGGLSYQGPCPPSGTHHYVFKIYALDVLLNLPLGASKKEVEGAMAGHIIGQGELVGLYSRQ
ncbi:MAG: YbhB/YbcL family Raf kinase inhibitor-like protein [Candidatus Taylorbacteria bacterium]|nr:YbhB/YbcL family Raf kinase inhibitor-like protein [Candidatus Taylorbacteria bacterium]